MTTPLILALDQGTTSTRVFLFDTTGNILSHAQKSHEQYYPKPGWVEHDAEEIWQNTSELMKQVVQSDLSYLERIQACGITNQRETIVAWDKVSGKVLSQAIVWQDNRTEATCKALMDSGYGGMVQTKTGLIPNPYFSASKIQWLIENDEKVKEALTDGRLAFGTMDTFLIYRLTNGSSFKTDVTNASRTLLYHIANMGWDSELLELFKVPLESLAEVMDCDSHFGDITLFDKPIPITGVAGDQQAASIGQCCFEPSEAKMTFGTGGFFLMNTGDKIAFSKHRLLSTVAYRIQGKTAYAIEGSIFHAASIINWMQKKLSIFERPEDCDKLAESARECPELVFVPSFTGLGAPHWRANLKAAWFGMTLDNSRAELVQSALRSIACQACDLFDAIEQDGLPRVSMLKVDGGVSQSNWLMQYLADLGHTKIVRPAELETTVLGAMYLAGIGAGIFKSLEELKSLWHEQVRFTPTEGFDPTPYKQYWQEAIQRLLD